MTEQIRSQEGILRIIGYHQETKHHFSRYARSLGYLDWSNQPDPFRRFEGAPLVSLPLLSADEEPLSPRYEELYGRGAVAVQPVSVRTLSRFFEYALALSAWKEANGVRWALRSNPSSGNLHPTEGYLLVGALPGLSATPALYHYAPKEHALERRADLSERGFALLVREFPSPVFLLAFSSIHWRESWKYGERAFRYCQHDIGHAIGAARIAAAALGWGMVLLDDVGDEALAALLGLDRGEDFEGVEREYPACIAAVWPNHHDGPHAAQPKTIPLVLPDVHELILNWHGKANRLSRGRPDPWEPIDVVTEASWKPATGPRTIELAGIGPTGSHLPGGPLAGQIIHQRRSALGFDGKTSIPAKRFFRMLRRILPCSHQALGDRPMPWDVMPWNATTHLALFVHRIDGLQPGLYLLVRDPAQEAAVRQATHEHFAWSTPPECPDDLPLFLLEVGDARRLATQVSCHQEIAGDGAFSLGMIAEFDPALRRHGPWFYRRLFWETGVIGQVLYLEAEAAGVRGTGMGCFFDDPVHQVFGFRDTAFHSLYHFATGGPVEDARLMTLPPYGWLK